MARRLTLAMAAALMLGGCATKPSAYFDETQAMAAAVVPMVVTGA